MKKIRFDILTLFPDMFNIMSESIIGRAVNDGLVEIEECPNAFKKLGAKIEYIDEFYLPQEQSKRINIFIKKENKTNPIYPRDFSKIKKSPLK